MPNTMLIAIVSLAAGSATAVAVNQVHSLQGQAPTPVEQLMLQSPIEQGPGTLAGAPPTQQPPEGMLPLDATPTPNHPPEPGSQRPAIQLKPTWLPSWLGGRDAKGSAELVLSRSPQTVAKTNDPIWQLQLKQNGQILATLPALSGRANRQALNRHTSGNKSPLPPGRYSIGRYGIERGPFADPELGTGYWIPIQPLFNTGRSDLGFHQDPSWGKTNGESGTSGCIGLESAAATEELVTWIKTFNIRQLTVLS